MGYFTWLSKSIQMTKTFSSVWSNNSRVTQSRYTVILSKQKIPNDEMSKYKF
jgi:hypothetical protein